MLKPADAPLRMQRLDRPLGSIRLLSARLGSVRLGSVRFGFETRIARHLYRNTTFIFGYRHPDSGQDYFARSGSQNHIQGIALCPAPPQAAIPVRGVDHPGGGIFKSRQAYKKVNCPRERISINSVPDTTMGRYSRMLLLVSLALLHVCLAQQIYHDVPLIRSRSQCPTSKRSLTPSYAFSNFSFSQSTTRRTATALAIPTGKTTYAAPYSSLSHFLPSLSTTSWGSWNISGPQATDSANPYGHSAWTSQWLRASVASDLASVSSKFSTTVQPTPVPTSELVFPDADPFGPRDCYTFPKDFMFGVSGAAAQIEGAIAQEGRAPSFADKFIGPEFVLDIYGRNRSRDFVANENYFYYKQDIERLAAIGAEYYSFSIPWSRILPFTFPGTPVNSEALDHYSDLIDFAISRGIKPVITMLHIDTPLAFYPNVSDTGRDPLYGFIDYAAGQPGFEDAFVNYGKILMMHFADRVPAWIT